MNKKITVAITGMNAIPHNPGPGVVVARCIRESQAFKGRIIGLAYDALDPGLYLPQYCDNAYLLPYPLFGEHAMLKRIQDIHQTENIDILIPCLDSELLSMVRIEPELKAIGIRMLLPTQPQVTLRNKENLASLAKQIDVQTPTVLPITQLSFFDACLQKGWTYPFVVKGLFYDAYTVHSAEEGKAAFRKIAGQWGLPILVQKHLTGEEVNLTAIGDGKGRLIAPVMMKKRGVTEKGKAWAGISIQDPSLLKIGRRFAAETKWKGPLELEMMCCKNVYYLIEINPRFPAWIYLSVGVHRNLPSALIDILMERELPRFPAMQSGISFIRYAEETIVPLATFEAVAIHGARNSLRKAG
ncbi:MAG: ATP-grasp domain-containing protein [Gammaproteobacteria bacterium]|nr:ATP-grasp domain-containing protein [Gammaproteobacteria bacterium]